MARAKARPVRSAPRKRKGARPPPRLQARLAQATRRVRKKPKPKSAKKSQGRAIPKTHGNMFSITHPIPTPVAEACGSALPYAGIFRHELAVSTERVVVLFSNVGRSGTVALVVGLPTAGAAGLTVRTIPTLSLGDDAGGPTSCKAMKGCFSLVNVTAPLNRAGRVTVLNSKQRFLVGAPFSTMTLAQWATFVDTVKTHPDAVSYGGHDFEHPVSFHTYPVDSRAYGEFHDFAGATTSDEFGRSIAIWPGVDPYVRPMSCIVTIFEIPPSTQEYTLSFRAAYYTRWPLNTIPGQTQRRIPTAPLDLINRHVQAMEAAGSRGAPDPFSGIG